VSNVVRVFIADDHQIVVDGIKSLLEDTEFFVSGEASDGQEAFEKLSADPYFTDILLSDISMPVVGGIELCRLVKNHLSHIRVLILSMYSTPPLVREAIMAEADGFLLKTAGRDELLKALRRVYQHATYYSDQLIPIIQTLLTHERKTPWREEMLTDREMEVLKLIVREYTSEEIARELFISKRTVDNHRLSILHKTGCRGTVGLVKYAIRLGLVY
jgi:DNA-binding NarL/FixJ family response regulator